MDAGASLHRAASNLNIDFQSITNLFLRAEESGRDFLYEHECYELLRHSGAETPPTTVLLEKGSRPSDELLGSMGGDRVVLKIVSNSIFHKSEFGGVRIVENTPDKVRSAWRRMTHEVGENYGRHLENNLDQRPETYGDLRGEALQDAITDDIQGVLLVQYMPPDSEAFGNEMIVGIRNTREFGMIISAGLGGIDTELYAERFRKGQAIVAASTTMTDGLNFFELFRQTISYKKLAGLTRGQRRIVTDEQLVECLSSFIEMANHYSPENPTAPYVIEELEINPFSFSDYLMVPLDGMCRFSRPEPLLPARPYHKIEDLLHPQTIGVIGVSISRVNFGRIIVKNIIAQGFNPGDIRIIRPGIEEFEGIRCVADFGSLDVKLDLLVVAVSSEQVPDLVDQIIAHDCAEAVLLIAGGMGETANSAARGARVSERIARAHREEGGGPVFLGANCLGVVSHPGRFDTMFIPDAKLPKQRGERPRNAAFVSQSGAFMITRLSKRPELDPAYMVSVGNQNDLTLGDLLSYLKEEDDIDIIGVYAEGFNDLDGLQFCRAVKDAVIRGKDVIFYKAGRTEEGKSATSGHTASLAGDYMVCESLIRQAGGIVAATFSEFEDLLLLSQLLHNKQVNGARLAALSGAGFEAVGIADNIQSDDFTLGMANISLETAQKIRDLMVRKQLDSLVTIKNPLDINPGADDEVHVETVRLLAEDSHVDAVVVGLDPLSPAMRTLAECKVGKYDFNDPSSIAMTLPALLRGLQKPVVGVVDAGQLYDPLVDALTEKDVPVFRSSDRAVRALALYLEGRVVAERLRADSS